MRWLSGIVIKIIKRKRNKKLTNNNVTSNTIQVEEMEGNNSSKYIYNIQIVGKITKRVQFPYASDIQVCNVMLYYI